MKVLRDRIMQDGRCLEGGILKVDRFINHQMDPYLMKQIAIEFIRRFANEDINKIITVEASGIAPAIMLGYLMELPVVFAKKKKPSTMSDFYQSTVHSFTKQREYPLTVSREYLTMTTVCCSLTISLPTAMRDWASSTSAVRLVPPSSAWALSSRKVSSMEGKCCWSMASNALSHLPLSSL